MRRVLAVVAILVATQSVSAQITGGPLRPTRPTTNQRRAPGDTTSRADSLRGDSAASHEIVKWVEPDSVTAALLARVGYTATRYQGVNVNFDAAKRILYLEGNSKVGRAAVGRAGTILVGDTITYNDSTKVVVALGDTLLLRDPARGTADVVALGKMTYNVEERRGSVTNISTSIESGEQWFVRGSVAAFRNDTTGGKSTAFYARNGIITSCDDSVPDYHFASKEIKLISKNIMVARPAVLYIGDVPVFYLPFIFQDMRSGRRSGLLTPRFGVGEIFRNSPSYRRHLDNLGYYFAFSDYMDGQISLDWRSGASASSGDPGWVRLNGEWRYRWLDRFLTGRLAVSRLEQRDGTKNTAISWGHQQDFSQTTHLTTDINYVTSTRLQRQNTFDPRQALATISSHANYSQQFGPASMSIGGSRTQYPGRDDVSQDFPNFNISTPTIPIASWLEWTPSLQVNNSEQLKVKRIGEFANSLKIVGGVLDTTQLTSDSRLTNLSFGTPLKIFGFSLNNTITAIDQENNQPQRIDVVNQDDPTQVTNRVFARTFSSQLDWSTSFGLPTLMQSTLKLSPNISLQNVDGHAFYVRTEQTGGRFVHQSKRPSYSLSASPTFFVLFPGVFGVSRFRHSVSPQITYSYAPAKTVSREYLAALNINPRDYLGNFASNQVTLNVSQVLEAKLKSSDTTGLAETRKVKLLAIGMSPLSYDFERKRKTGHSGFTNDAFGYTLNSDLLPGFNLGVNYSLFQGNPLSDSSKFKPFRTDVNASFSFNGNSGIFGALARIFGRAIPNTSPQTERLSQNADDALGQRAASMPVAGGANRSNLYSVPSSQVWQASFTFTSSRQRPPTGNGTIVDQDPRTLCQGFLPASPLSYDLCILQQSQNPTSAAPITGITAGAPFVRVPSRENLTSSMSFHLTPKWSGGWHTTYDFQTQRFASHAVTLQRELHDWRAIFAFTRTPTGNFSFNFFIALNAQPDIKFNYDKQTYRQTGQ
ncbi:MAG: putative LPS assembly protein LptD [Gemmatimonadaceae bacterium]